MLKECVTYLIRFIIEERNGAYEITTLSLSVRPHFSSSKPADRFLRNFVVVLLHYILRPNHSFNFLMHSTS